MDTPLIPGRGLDYVLEAHEVQALLPADVVLISYFFYTDHDGEEQTVAFLITSKAVRAIPLNVGLSDITHETEVFHESYKVSTFDPHPESLQRLYAWLIVPLAEFLNTSQLIIVPHGVLHYLPFTALSDGRQYLGDQYAISTLPSASILPLLAEGHSQANQPLVLGNPINDLGLDNLLEAEAEANNIAELYNDRAYTGPDATESLVRAQAGSHSVLHIASHAEFNPAAPLQSRLVLAADESSDGLLQVDEVYGLNLEETDLVILSACQTNVGNVSPGDDILALNRAFLFAGTPTVIASLWNVDDEATSILMTRFYTYLNEGRGSAEALRQAQVDLRTEHPQYAHPFYWAAFVLSGDGGEVTQKNEHRPVFCFGAALPLALAFIGLGYKRRRRIS